MDLQTAVKLWPTPTATERSGINPKTGRGAGLSKAVKLAAPQASEKLNPDWVEVLMGFPVGWTDLDKTDIDLTNKFPQAWLDGSWEEGIPRTTTRRDGRAARLKQLGNALVPQVVEFIGMAIMLRERTGGD
jgi:DNA (cytosine-5)-methyltransferase 1